MRQPSTIFPRRQARRSIGGFTLVELMVTVGIIVTIASIALPIVLMAKRKGTETRIKSDLALIDTAISAYKGDFGDIPRFADAASDQANASGQWLDYSADRGARLLCFALISPGPAGTTISNGVSVAQPGEDGADGPGFRVRRNAAGGSGPLQGKIYGPYVQIEKFKIETDNTGRFPNFQDAKMLDVNGNPILYYPALPGTPLITTANSYVAAVDPSQSGSVTATKPLYNAYDNTLDTTPSANGRNFVKIVDMQTLMNADPATGAQLAGANATFTGPYILWTAGIDGKYGLDSNGKTDDIANFDWPAQFRR